MANDLSDDLNALVRSWIRQLLQGDMNQTELAARLGTTQTTVSQLGKAGSTRGTTAMVFVAAGRLVGVPDEELARHLGLTIAGTTAPAFSAAFLDECPPHLRRYLTEQQASMPPVVAQQLLRIFQLDRVDRGVTSWRTLASVLMATAVPEPANDEEEHAAPSSRRNWSATKLRRSSGKLRVTQRR